MNHVPHMKARFRSINCFFVTLLVFVLMGCSAERWYPKAAEDEVCEQNLGGFPYYPLVYHLDLSILSYELYGQTLVWPFDPYYEEANNGRGNRKQIMEKVRSWAKNKGAEQLEIETGLSSYRGPGVLGGFEYPGFSNLSDYTKIINVLFIPNDFNHFKPLVARGYLYLNRYW